MAKRRYVLDSFRSDPRIEDLDPLERYLYLYLITNEHVWICWFYEIKIRRIAFETGIEKEMAQKMISRFTEDWKVFYKDDLMFIVNFVKNQSIKTESDNLRKWVVRDFEALWSEKTSKILSLEGPYKVVEGAYKDVPIPYFTLLYSTLPNLTSPNGKKIEEQKTFQSSEQKEIAIAEKEAPPIPLAPPQTKYPFVEEFVKEQMHKHQVQYAIKNKWFDEYMDEQYAMVDTIVRLDWYTIEQIALVLEYVLWDEFWRDNILTVWKLRKKDKSKIPYMAVMLDKAKKAMDETQQAQMNLAPIPTL